jgi:hypothetical protein
MVGFLALMVLSAGALAMRIRDVLQLGVRSGHMQD